MSLHSASKPHLIKSRYLFALIIAVCVLIGYVVYQFVFSREIDREVDRNRQYLESLSLSLNATLQKYEELPLVIAQDRRIRNALEHANKSVILGEANRYLERINQILGTETVYTMNEHGLTIVSSNWNKPDSFVGDNYAFRPYYIDAVRQGVGKFYGVGIASGKAGYYIAYPIKSDQDLLGVITIKIGLAEIQKALSETKNDLVVINEDGVVILSSDPANRYKTTRILDEAALERIANTRQFPGQSLSPLNHMGFQVQMDLKQPVSLLGGNRLMVQSVPLGSRGWQIAQINDTREARNYAVASALAVGFAMGFLLITAQNIYFRRRERQEKRQLYADIDAKIAERTMELTAKISELERAEAVLRQTRDEAVQAGKMAVLGQMAAGVTHELSQPLSAIQLYAGNARKLIDAGRLDVVTENIDSINELVARAGSILSELKTLYRNDPTSIEAVPLKSVIQNALLVMKPFVEKAAINLNISVMDEQVFGSRGKLEQVFVNLLSNAIDALSGRPDAHIDIVAERTPSEVTVHFSDNGPGISNAQIDKLFEPFYTTKPSGQGLGLGLAITRFIVDSVGGRITCANLPAGGLEFTLYLRDAGSHS
ncbi:MAG: sensor histidine kinase [Rhodocyclales bacterium]|nr:sensor histidine kinase [Rhodocyclales bacterium]